MVLQGSKENTVKYWWGLCQSDCNKLTSGEGLKLLSESEKCNKTDVITAHSALSIFSTFDLENNGRPRSSKMTKWRNMHFKFFGVFFFVLSFQVSFNNTRLLVAVRTNALYCTVPFAGRPDRPEIASTDDCVLHFHLQLIKLSLACAVPPDYASGRFYCCS